MALNHSITLAFEFENLTFYMHSGIVETLANLATLGFRLIELFGISAGWRGDPERYCFVTRSQQGQTNDCEDT